MEKAIIKRTFIYLFSRDIWLLLLVSVHTLVSLNLFPYIKTALLAALGLGTVLWLLFYSRLLSLAFRLRKNSYIKEAFKDEYFVNIRLKSGFNAYTCMLAVGLVLTASAVISDLLSLGVSLPVYTACEIVILSGVITDDISKILMSRG